MTEWLAIGVGLAGGLLACLYWAQRVLPPLVARARHPRLMVKLAFGGTAVMLLPALLLSIAAGAPLGARGGALGIVAGVAMVFVLVLAAGAAAGVLLARWLSQVAKRPR